MADLKLTLAVNDYDHIRDLVTGRVRAEGIDLTSLVMSVEEIFYRFTAFREWDVSELSFAKYASLVGSGDPSVQAIPVFPSRVFRHGAFYVRDDGSVRAPAELAGRRVGVPEWIQTAGVYARGVLQHQYGVPLGDVGWVQAGLNEAGREELVAPKLPAGVSIEAVNDRTLQDMLVEGDLDAVISARPPQRLLDGDRRIRRLFDDPRKVEEAHYRETGIFPIMHTVAIRAEVLEAYPWVAGNLMTAFTQAKERSLERLRDVNTSRFPVPWSHDLGRQASELLGPDPWPYGIEPNRPTLEAFLRFAHEQGVSERALTPEDLFPPSVRRSFRV
jgi:4,5-dihydroxyphthalate decarboxylase